MFVLVEKKTGNIYAWKRNSPVPPHLIAKQLGVYRYDGEILGGDVRSGMRIDYKIPRGSKMLARLVEESRPRRRGEVSSYGQVPSRTQRGGAIESLTEVQARALVPGIAGVDILAKSNTGSGKTLAFLIASIERILKNGGPDPTQSIPILILTPVTDLAIQIMGVATRLLAYHPGFVATRVIGGEESPDMAPGRRIDIVVATLGRFTGLIKIAKGKGILDRLKSVQTLIIDEADRMLKDDSIGDVRMIRSRIENPNLQTMLFSATMDVEVIKKTGFLRPDFAFIDTAGPDSGVAQVNTRVIKTVFVTPADSLFNTLVKSIRGVANIQQKTPPQHQLGGNFKRMSRPSIRQQLSDGTVRALAEWQMSSFSGTRIMVFIPSNAMIDFMFDLFAATKTPNVRALKLHGGMNQSQRTRASETFRTTDNCVLFTSDASARGVDYPDVTSIIQLGFDGRDEYIQRVGRTGRTGGKDGRTVLILTPDEVACLDSISDVVSEVFVSDDITIPQSVTNVRKSIQVPSRSMSMAVGTKAAKSAFRGWLGSLASKWRSKDVRMTPENTLNLARNMASAMGISPEPAQEDLKKKLNIKS